MVQIPLYHRSCETGELITVDDHLYPVISRIHWSTGDIRRPQSPRHVARLHGEPFTISLNRVIYALSHNSKLLDRDIFASELGLLKHEMALHPPLVFEDNNVLNCTTANIVPRALSRKGMKPRDIAPLLLDGDSPPLALPPSSSPVVVVEYGEKGIGSFVAHAPRDIKEPPSDDLSKLFSHLDASSDPSITKKEGGK